MDVIKLEVDTSKTQEACEHQTCMLSTTYVLVIVVTQNYHL